MTTTTRPHTTEITGRLIEAVRAYRFEDLPEDVVITARQCLLDWLGVTLAGSGEPLTRILRKEVLEQGGQEQATLLGTGTRVSMAQAALVNGAASHALDFDDVQLLMSSF
jgi:2-methylcitrate dehydratase PrpD